MLESFLVLMGLCLSAVFSITSMMKGHRWAGVVFIVCFFIILNGVLTHGLRGTI